MDEIEQLIQDLKNPDIGEKAANRLAELKDARALPPLIDIIKDKDSEINMKFYSILALGKFGEIAAITPLLNIIERNENEYLQPKAIDALMDILNTGNVDKKMKFRIINVLISVIKITESEPGIPALRVSAIRTLCNSPLPEFLNLFKGKLKDENSTIRHVSATVLANIQDRSAIPDLIATLDYKDEIVREAVVRALGRFNDIRNIPFFIRALDDGYFGVRQCAALVLSILFNKCETLEDSNQLIQKLDESLAELRMKRGNNDDTRRLETEIAYWRMKAFSKRNRITSQQDIFLSDIPKPPKRGPMYRSLRRVRNG